MPVVTRMNFLELIVFLQVQFPRGLKQLDHEKTIDDDYARGTKYRSKDKQSKSAQLYKFFITEDKTMSSFFNAQKTVNSLLYG